MKIVRLAVLILCSYALLVHVNAADLEATEDELSGVTEEQVNEEQTEAEEIIELKNATDEEGSVSETSDSGESADEDSRIRNLRELDTAALNDYCSDDGTCRGLVYDNPRDVVFFESRPKVRFTSDNTYVFKPSPQFDVLRFVDSKFANFPVNLFYALKVKELDMRNCSMERLNWDSFVMANELSILLLSLNRLKEIRPSSFSHAEQLSFLFLDSNEIKSLDSQSFKDLNNLYILDLHDNQVEVLPPGVFSYLRALQQLNLAGNRLTTLTDGTFTNNIHLRSLNVQSNRLESLDEYVFQNQDYMDYLDLSHNQDLQTLVGNIRADNFWVRNCSLTRVNIYGKVKNVDFQMNHIMELYFSQPDFLESLKLKDNSLQQVASLAQATNLLLFDVSNNPNLRTLPEFWEVDSLERLDLSNTSLRSIPLSVIESPERLTSLNVSSNRLTHIDPLHFPHYEKLNQFYINNNDWNCYNLQLFMDMVIRPFDISYNLDPYDAEFPGEYIGGIKCMYRLDDGDWQDSSDEDRNEKNTLLGTKDQLNISGLAEQLNEAPENSATAEVSEVELLRREFKAVVGIYEQKFSIVLNKLKSLDQRLKQFERFNKTMWQKVTISV